jgi:DNA-binding transcriptional regulator YbjK
MGRRDDIGDAGIRCIALGGARALTHRAVDTEAGIPPGSTSYYARNRRDLTRLVAERITEQLEADLAALTLPDNLDTATATRAAVSFLNVIGARDQAQAARFALLFELRGDDDVRRTLTADAAVRVALNQAAGSLLAAIGVDNPKQHAPSLVALIDALLLYRVAGIGHVDSEAIIGAYVRGLPRSVAPSR